MKKVFISVFIYVILISFLLLSGCRSVPFSPGERFADDILLNDLAESVEHMYPDNFSAVHRCILEFAGKNIVLNGYLTVEREKNKFRMVAQSEMGGTVFGIAYDAGEITLSDRVKQIRKIWLEEGAARDISAIYLKTPSIKNGLEKYTSGCIGISGEQKGGIREAFIFENGSDDSKKHLLKSFVMLNGNKCIYRADFSNYGVFPEWLHNVPRTITINDYKLKYRMTVNVLYLSPKKQS